MGIMWFSLTAQKTPWGSQSQVCTGSSSIPCAVSVDQMFQIGISEGRIFPYNLKALNSPRSDEAVPLTPAELVLRYEEHPLHTEGHRCLFQSTAALSRLCAERICSVRVLLCAEVSYLLV